MPGSATKVAIPYRGSFRMSDFFLVVSLITMLIGGKDVGTATGFFYVKNETTYLVTNRHVVVDETKGLKPDALRLKLHTDARNVTKNVDRTIPLYDNGAPQWHVHRDYPKVPINIAVIEIEPKQLEGTLIKTLSREAVFPEDKIHSFTGRRCYSAWVS